MRSAPFGSLEIVVGSHTLDTPALIELSETVYGPHPDLSSEAYHEWLYEGAPAGPAIQASAFSNGKMVGHYAVVPLAFADTAGEFRAGLGVNAIVRPEAEGRGLFARLVSAADRAAAAAGLELLYVVPGPQSEPWFTTVLRYERDGELSLFVEPLRLRELLRVGPARIRLLAAAGFFIDPFLHIMSAVASRPRSHRHLEIDTVDRFETDFDELWCRVRRSAGRTTARTSQFLNWRYASCPSRKYRILAARSGSHLLAYVVSRIRGIQRFPDVRLGSIVDLVSDGTSEGDHAAIVLVADACRTLRREGSDAIVAQLRIPSPLGRMLHRVGLWRIPGKHLGYRPIAFKGRSAVSKKPYHFMGGDFDMG